MSIIYKHIDMDSYLAKYAAGGLSIVYDHLTSTRETQSIEILDPLCCAMKLSVLHYKKPGTKISIKHHSIEIQDTWTLQGVQRWLNNDERDQLCHLRAPLLYFRGLTLGHIESKIESKRLVQINESALRGLAQLVKTYDHGRTTGSMVRNCLHDYVKILQTEFTRDEYNRELELSHMPTIYVIFNEFTKKWHNTDIDMFINLFNYGDQIEPCPEISIAIDALIKIKDNQINLIRPG